MRGAEIWTGFGGAMRGVAIHASAGEALRTIGSTLLPESPFVIDDTLFSGTTDEVVVAIDVQSGAERWRSPKLGSVFPAPLAASGDRVYGLAAAQGGKTAILFALDMASGAERWRTAMPDLDMPTVIVADESVLVSNGRGVHSRDAATGMERWSVSLDAPVRARSAFDGTSVYVADDGGVIQAIEASTGARRWEWRGSVARGHLCVAGDTLYAAPEQKIVAIDTASGRELWAIPMTGKSGDAKAIIPHVGSLYVTRSKEILALQRGVGGPKRFV